MQSILGTLSYYEKVLGPGKKDAFQQICSAIRRDLMTGWGFPLPPKRSTKTDLAMRQQTLEQLPIEKLYDWEIALEKGFDRLGKTEKQRTPSRSHIRGFVQWCLESGILVDPKRHEETVKKAPDFNRKKRPKARRNPCDLSPYTLSEAQLTPALRQSIDDFKRYLVEDYYEGRIKGPVRKSTWTHHHRNLLGILGWLHYHCEVPLSELSLNLIVSPQDLQDTTAAQQAAREFRSLMSGFWVFLQGRGNSAGSMVKHLSALTRFIQYQHVGKYVNLHGNDIPVMQVVRELINYYNQCQQDELDPIPFEFKWLELPDFIQQVTLPSFSATEYKTRSGQIRSQAAITSSIQDAILWSLFSLMPPRRAGEWRTCKLAMSCELAEKPQDLQPGDWIWPLPPTRYTKAELSYGYLTRQYVYQDPVTQERFGSYFGTAPPTGRYLERVPLWFKHTPRQAAKSGDSHGHQEVLVMNRQVYRNKTLYDFLEAYVMGYWRDRYGNWCSLGQSLTAPHDGFQYFPLRSAIAADARTALPDEPGQMVPPVWLFVGRVKGKPYRDGDFGGKLARAAYRLSGKFVTPHLLRSMYAVYVIETVGDRSTLASLAVAMGHMLETLDRVYDKRRSDRKMRRAELVLTPHLDRICAGLPTTVQRSQSMDLSTLASQVQQLSPQQRQQLAALL
ncbi:MAG: hypothetical protein O3C67_00290 [Cyanobacteria bacterium]|nr:hypothetical protein [Cyanobacteriota bacterium]